MWNVKNQEANFLLVSGWLPEPFDRVFLIRFGLRQNR